MKNDFYRNARINRLSKLCAEIVSEIVEHAIGEVCIQGLHEDLRDFIEQWMDKMFESREEMNMLEDGRYTPIRFRPKPDEKE